MINVINAIAHLIFKLIFVNQIATMDLALIVIEYAENVVRYILDVQNAIQVNALNVQALNISYKMFQTVVLPALIVAL